jgi:glycerophosphoryl diester phosphodiesterase
MIKGMKIIPWTVNDSKQVKKLKKMGVDGIITDYPDLFKN